MDANIRCLLQGLLKKAPGFLKPPYGSNHVPELRTFGSSLPPLTTAEPESNLQPFLEGEREGGSIYIYTCTHIYMHIHIDTYIHVSTCTHM